MDVRFFRTAAGAEPVLEHLRSLSQDQRDAAGKAIRSIQSHGLHVPNVSLRQVKGKLWEIRASDQRVFYVVADAGVVWLLHAYKKQGQKAPLGEIAVAQARMKDVLARR
jgi:phage-related protein